jgi:hypothetical protein
MPECPTITMHHLNPIVSLIQDGIERVQPSFAAEPHRWGTSIAKAASQARLASNYGPCVRISSALSSRGRSIEPQDVEQSP